MGEEVFDKCGVESLGVALPLPACGPGWSVFRAGLRLRVICGKSNTETLAGDDVFAVGQQRAL